MLTKLDPNGALVFSTYLGGNCNDTISTIAVDAGGDAWVAGFTYSSTFPMVWPADAAGPVASSSKGFVTRFAASGAWVWRSSYLRGYPTQALAADAAGNVYIGITGGLLKVTPQP